MPVRLAHLEGRVARPVASLLVCESAIQRRREIYLANNPVPACAGRGEQAAGFTRRKAHDRTQARSTETQLVRRWDCQHPHLHAFRQQQLQRAVVPTLQLQQRPVRLEIEKLPTHRLKAGEHLYRSRRVAGECQERVSRRARRLGCVEIHAAHAKALQSARQRVRNEFGDAPDCSSSR
jgi:hypothetical protein